MTMKQSPTCQAGVAFEIEKAHVALLAEGLRFRRKIRSDDDRRRIELRDPASTLPFAQHRATCSGFAKGVRFAGQNLAVTEDLNVRQDSGKAASGLQTRNAIPGA